MGARRPRGGALEGKASAGAGTRYFEQMVKPRGQETRCYRKCCAQHGVPQKMGISCSRMKAVNE
jgi:hypothetical protein